MRQTDTSWDLGFVLVVRSTLVAEEAESPIGRILYRFGVISDYGLPRASKTTCDL